MSGTSGGPSQVAPRSLRELRLLALEHELDMSGDAAALTERLLAAGVDAETLGLDSASDAPTAATANSASRADQPDASVGSSDAGVLVVDDDVDATPPVLAHDTEDELLALRKADLLELADAEGAEASPRMTKAQIVEALLDARAAATGADDDVPDRSDRAASGRPPRESATGTGTGTGAAEGALLLDDEPPSSSVTLDAETIEEEVADPVTDHHRDGTSARGRRRSSQTDRELEAGTGEDPTDADEPLDAVLLDAELVDEPTDPTPASATRAAATATRSGRARGDQVPGPLAYLTAPEHRTRTIAIGLAVLLIVGGPAVWYMLRFGPFTPEPLHYGDELDVRITAASRSHLGIEGKDLIDSVLGDLNEEYGCEEIDIEFSGTGTLAIERGGAADFVTSTLASGTIPGSVPQLDGYGRELLTIERSMALELAHEVEADCRLEALDGNLSIRQRSWSHLTDDNAIRQDLDLHVDAEGVDGPLRLDSTAHVGGTLLGALGDLMPGLNHALSPIEVRQLTDGAEVTPGAEDEWDGWAWKVREDSEQVSGERVYVIDLEYIQIRDNDCLGRTQVRLDVAPDRPWPVRQQVDLFITTERLDGCGNLISLILAAADDDWTPPEGSLTYQVEFLAGDFRAGGGDRVDVVLDYAGKPGRSEGKPQPTHDWGANGHHLPDNTTRRSFSLEDAVACSTLPSSMRQALGSTGYVSQAIHNQSGAVPTWNLTWVNEASGELLAGWALVAEPSGPNASCDLLDNDVLEGDARPSYDRSGIPTTLSLAQVETRLIQGVAHPELSALIAPGGQMRSELNLGYRYGAPGALLSGLSDEIDGVVLVFVTGEWTDAAGHHSVDLAVNAEDGLLQGWADYDLPTAD